MRKINFLFPVVILIALAGSAFTKQSSQKKTKAFPIDAYYRDASNFCQYSPVDDPNCSPDLLGPVCEEFQMDVGWTVMFEFGTTTICWQPLYSLYPNNP